MNKNHLIKITNRCTLLALIYAAVLTSCYSGDSESTIIGGNSVTQQPENSMPRDQDPNDVNKPDDISHVNELRLKAKVVRSENKSGSNNEKGGKNVEPLDAKPNDNRSNQPQFSIDARAETNNLPIEVTKLSSLSARELNNYINKAEFNTSQKFLSSLTPDQVAQIDFNIFKPTPQQVYDLLFFGTSEPFRENKKINAIYKNMQNYAHAASHIIRFTKILTTAHIEMLGEVLKGTLILQAFTAKQVTGLDFSKFKLDRMSAESIFKNSPNKEENLNALTPAQRIQLEDLIKGF